MTDILSLSPALNRLRECLPHHAEEGTLRETIPESNLIAALQDGGIGKVAAEMLVVMLRCQFDSMALLDRADLAQARWSFVSFPASLFARSLIETWASGRAIVPADYWEQGDHRPVIVKEEQRALLYRIESERLRQNPDSRPIRTVHVAWALIRLGEQFLLHRREDVHRIGEKSHVLPGGRLNPSDLSADELNDGPAILRSLTSPDSPLADSGLDKTLVRELAEELGLHHREDYVFERWQRLPSFRDLAGTGNRLAYSEYAFLLYTLRLTPKGEVRLLEKVSTSSALAWFSIEELSSPHRADGASAYVDVLHATWGEDVGHQLERVPDSGAASLAMTGELHMLDLPATQGAPWKVGKPGKERTHSIELGESEWQLLMLLGWQARGFAIRPEAGIHLLGGGWVRVDHEDARFSARTLLAKAQKSDLSLVEIRDRRYVRLSIEPSILMFGPALFTYDIEGDDREGGVLRVTRSTIPTPWGNLAGESVSLEVNGNTLRILRLLERGEDPLGRSDLLAGDWERNLRQQLTPALRRIGLRKLWSTANKAASLVDDIRPIAPR